MFVDRSMTKKVVTIKKESDLFTALERMRAHNIRHLPVVDDDNRLIGVVTDRDMRSAMPLRLFMDINLMEEREKIAKLKVADIMSTQLVTITAMDTIQDALLLIQRSKVGALPVVDEDNRLKGIISVRDLLRAFINVLGIGEPGTLLGVVVEDKVGNMKRLVDAVTEEGISFGSVLVARYWQEGKRAVFPYLLTNNVAGIKKKFEQMGYKLLDPMEWYLDRIPRDL